MSIINKLKKLSPTHRMSENLYQTMCENQNGIMQEFKNLSKKIDFLFWTSQNDANETDLETRNRVFMSMPKARGKLRMTQIGSFTILKRIKEYARNVYSCINGFNYVYCHEESSFSI